MKTIRISNGMSVIVDDDDFYILSKWRWSAKETKHTTYAKRMQIINGKSTEIKMHRQIMMVEFDNSVFVDHKDGNGLNNQKNNLRVCTRSQNNMNARKRKNATSRFKGVSFQQSSKGHKKWVAQIYCNKKNYYLGRYFTEIEAAKAYDKKAIELHGEFSVLNFDKTKL